jgi:hypothetical protein
VSTNRKRQVLESLSKEVFEGFLIDICIRPLTDGFCVTCQKGIFKCAVEFSHQDFARHDAVEFLAYEQSHILEKFNEAREQFESYVTLSRGVITDVSR